MERKKFCRLLFLSLFQTGSPYLAQAVLELHSSVLAFRERFSYRLHFTCVCLMVSSLRIDSKVKIYLSIVCPQYAYIHLVFLPL